MEKELEILKKHINEVSIAAENLFTKLKDAVLDIEKFEEVDQEYATAVIATHVERKIKSVGRELSDSRVSKYE